MNRPTRMTGALLASLALALGLGGCTYYQTAPGVYAPMPNAFERSWSAAVGALEDVPGPAIHADLGELVTGRRPGRERDDERNI